MTSTTGNSAGSEPRHGGSYPEYHALWHLERLGVVTDLHRFASPDAWNAVQSGGRKTRVALIDTSVDWTHPCLAPAIDRARMIDLAARDFGVFTVPQDDLTGAEAQARAEVIAAAAAGAGQGNALRDRFLRDLGRAHETQDGYRAAASSAFSGHGTSMAGLIGARPVDNVWLHRPARLSPDPREAGETGAALPYAGIDPFCEIVPISTSALPFPDQMCAALIYADLIGADVIAFAASIPDPTLAGVAMVDAEPPATGKVPAGQTAMGDEALPSDPDLLTRWTELKALILDVSQRRLILCAAGNAADGMLSYPANLARDDNGIVAVGACTSDGMRAGYSAGGDSHHPVTLFALSGDGPVADRDLYRLDPFAELPGTDARRLFDRAGAQMMAVETLISTDVAGRPGYSTSPYAKVWRDTPGPDGAPVAYEFTSFFCEFSGTSAATAVATGLIALGFSTGRITRATAPSEIKGALVGGRNYDGEKGEPALTWRNMGADSGG